MSRIAAVLLAAGASQRFGAEDKLLADLNGAPVLSHVLKLMSRIDLSQRIAVIGPGAERVMQMCEEAGFEVVINNNAAAGLGSSIATGVRRLSNVDAAMFFLGDMPLIKLETTKALLDQYPADSDAAIMAPTYKGRRGHPAIFGRQHFSALAALTGHDGGKDIINANRSQLRLIPVEDQGVVQDIDTQDDLARFNQ